MRWIGAVPAVLLLTSTAAADDAARTSASAPTRRCTGLPGVEQLRTWPVVGVCAPGRGSARRMRSLHDGTFLFSGKDGCFRGRVMRCAAATAPLAPSPRPRPESGGWVHACPLAGLPLATLRIEPDHRVSLTDGTRTVATLQLRDDFSGRRVEVSCVRRFANLRVEYDGGKMYREVTLLWTRGHLVESGHGEGPVPPPGR